jgi:hypothetical protein
MSIIVLMRIGTIKKYLNPIYGLELRDEHKKCNKTRTYRGEA